MCFFFLNDKSHGPECHCINESARSPFFQFEILGVLHRDRCGPVGLHPGALDSGPSFGPLLMLSTETEFAPPSMV